MNASNAPDEIVKLPLRQEIEAGRPTTIAVRPQSDFTADDLELSWDGPSDAKVHVLRCVFGKDVIFTNTVGIGLSVFSPQSFVRGLVRGGFCPAGRDIRLSIASDKPGVVTGAFIGMHPTP